MTSVASNKLDASSRLGVFGEIKFVFRIEYIGLGCKWTEMELREYISCE